MFKIIFGVMLTVLYFLHEGHMDKCDYVKELEKELKNSGLKIFPNSDDSIDVFANNDDASIFLTIPLDFHSIKGDAKKIEESKKNIIDFLKSLRIKLHNLSVEISLNKLD